MTTVYKMNTDSAKVMVMKKSKLNGIIEKYAVNAMLVEFAIDFTNFFWTKAASDYECFLRVCLCDLHKYCRIKTSVCLCGWTQSSKDKLPSSLGIFWARKVSFSYPSLQTLQQFSQLGQFNEMYSEQLIGDYLCFVYYVA